MTRHTQLAKNGLCFTEKDIFKLDFEDFIILSYEERNENCQTGTNG